MTRSMPMAASRVPSMRRSAAAASSRRPCAAYQCGVSGRLSASRNEAAAAIAGTAQDRAGASPGPDDEPSDEPCDEPSAPQTSARPAPAGAVARTRGMSRRCPCSASSWASLGATIA